MSENSAVKDDIRPTHADRAGAKAAIPHELIAPSIEAILLSVDKPVSMGKLAGALGLAKAEQPAAAPEEGQPRPRRRAKAGADDASEPATAIQVIEAAVDELNSVYESSGRSFRIERVAGGYRIMSLPSFASILAAFHGSRASGRMGKAAVETLSIIAYKQPITRAHLEAIRGVGCGEILRSLLERRLVTIKGRAEELGRPILYGTTKEFLDAFGLATLKDLPTAAELQGL